MNADDVGSFLSRWSRRKLEKAEPAPAAEPPVPLADVVEATVPAEYLPPVESLTPDSDFKPFMLAEVDPGVKQAALKQLFKDPHFNVMDGLDTYVDDYSIADPIPEAMMKTLYQAREHLFSPEEKAAANAADEAGAAEANAAAADATPADPAAPPDKQA